MEVLENFLEMCFHSISPFVLHLKDFLETSAGRAFGTKTFLHSILAFLW